ncbi:MAG: cob(I)yrinic acid a,c-diamide adenosyltransferase [Luteolibacter sp.]
MSIITRRGDSGETDLLFGQRIAKTSSRMEVVGTIDELNAALGLARSVSPSEIVALLDGIQTRLIGLMGELATLPQDTAKYREKNYPRITEADVTWIFETATAYEKRGIRFSGWAIPGAEGSLGRAGLDFARTIARRAERRVWQLHESGEPVSEDIRLFFNRLSDLLWILARIDPSGEEK